MCAPQTRGINNVGGGLNTYVVSLTRVFQLVKCPVPVFPEVAHSTGRLQEHFMYRHFWSHVAVVQEGAEQLPRCDYYGIHMPAGWIIKKSADSNMRQEHSDAVAEKECSD